MATTSRKTALRRGQISREAVLDAAAEVLASEGLPGLTMRRVALRLGVEAMSLYHHVRGKRDILEGLVGRFLSGIATPDAAAPWPERLRALALDLYRILAANPWLVTALTTEQIEPREPPVLAAMEAALGIFEEAGLDPSQRVSAFRGLLALCLGLALTHTVGLQMSPDQAEAVFARSDIEQWAGLGVPRLAALAPQFLITRPRDDLMFMLDAFVRALKVQG
jgi:AcrR family transcriptional regulator